MTEAEDLNRKLKNPKQWSLEDCYLLLNQGDDYYWKEVGLELLDRCREAKRFLRWELDE